MNNDVIMSFSPMSVTRSRTVHEIIDFVRILKMNAKKRIKGLVKHLVVTLQRAARFSETFSIRITVTANQNE